MDSNRNRPSEAQARVKIQTRAIWQNTLCSQILSIEDQTGKGKQRNSRNRQTRKGYKGRHTESHVSKEDIKKHRKTDTNISILNAQIDTGRHIHRHTQRNINSNNILRET